MIRQNVGSNGRREIRQSLTSMIKEDVMKKNDLKFIDTYEKPHFAKAFLESDPAVERIWQTSAILEGGLNL